MKIRRTCFSLMLLSCIVSCGCAGLEMKNEPVSFESPATILKLREVQPTAEELSGVMLRQNSPLSGALRVQEHLKIYSRLRGDQGLGLDLHQTTDITFKSIPGKDSYLQRSLTKFDKNAGEITEEIEVSPRGEVIRFIEGKHESEAGKFQVTDLSRTPIYPEGTVRIGDSWDYEEKMTVKLESFWAKEKNPSPYELKAHSTLAGFAEVLGRRCAVVRTVSTQTKKITLKVLFKTITAEITANLEETQYLDYTQGVLIAKVSQTKSQSFFQELKVEEKGISQSVYYLVDEPSAVV